MVVPANEAQMDPRGLRQVEALFWEQIEQGLHPGAALAVYRFGNPVLDLHGGLANAEVGKPVHRDTLFILYSCTKALSAACLHLLWERGLLDWDDPVSHYWPEFGQNGKDQVTIRHILTHQGGFPESPPGLYWKKWIDWDNVVQAMEEIEPLYPPGTVMAYHHRNFGWVVGELVRRIDGRPINQVLREEITEPLGMSDAYMGLPPELEYRVSRLHVMDDCDRPGMVPPYNLPEVHQAVLPSGGGITTARDLARFFAMLGAGGALERTRILQPETVAAVTALQVEGMDHSLLQPMRRSLGLVLGDARMGASDTIAPSTFGHAGAGTSIAWADPESGLAVAYLTNGVRANHSNTPRLAAISRAVREACR